MKRKIFTTFTLVLTSFLLAAQVKIDPAGIVIIADSADHVPAAKELKSHLELITSCKIPLVTEKQKIPAGKKYRMFVGKVPAGGKKNFAVHEAYYTLGNKEGYFYGHKESGSLYAVYEFLETSLGVRWPWEDEIYAPKQNPLVISKKEGHWKAPFTLRFMRSGKKLIGQRLWKKRLRMAWADEWQYGTGDAQYGKWWKIYGATHPEFFAMNIQGIRAPAPTRLRKKAAKLDVDAYRGKDARVAFCCSSPAYLDEIIKHYEKNKGRWLNFSQPDVYAYECCYCEKCLALDPVKIKKGERLPDYGIADRYIHMTNALGDKVIPKYPDIKIMSEIYNYSRNPPRYAKIKYPDHVCYRMVPGDFTLKGIDSLIAGWKKAGMKKFFYRPNRHGHYVTLMPCGYEEYFFRILQKLVKAGCLGFDYDVASTYLHKGQYFSDYVLFKAMQDPSKDFAYWEKHYMQAFFPAEKEITAYYGYWRNEVWKKRLQKDVGKLEKIGKYYNFGRGLAWKMGNYYKDKDFTSSEKYLKKALARKDLPQDVRSRIEKIYFEHKHNFLTYKAITGKKDIYSLNLLEFREKNNLPLIRSDEKKWGDICGIGKVMQFRKYLPPYLETPVFWRFRLDPGNVGLKEKWYQHIDGKFSSRGEFMATNSNWETPHKHYKQISKEIRQKTARYDGIAWYAVKLPPIPENWKERRIFLYFGAVDESCTLYVNGKKAGERIFQKSTDWHTPFTIEITNQIDWTRKDQEAIVRVEDKNGAGGIWKRVYLVSKEK